MFDSHGKVDCASRSIGLSAKEMLDEMKLAAASGALQWRSAKSLCIYLSKRFQGGINSLPRYEDNCHGSKLWFGFARSMTSDECTGA